MSTELVRPEVGVSALVEQVVIQGDLAKLSPADRLAYYRAVCASVGLNPLTRPFEYIILNGKLVLYARRDATDQLRKLHAVTVQIMAREAVEDLYVVTARATDRSGRSDESIGAVALTGLKGEAKANALMKAETKAKRRVTLSICGLGLLDETEVVTVPGATAFVEPAEQPDPVSGLPTQAQVVAAFRAADERAAAPGYAAPEAPPTAPFEEWVRAFGQVQTLESAKRLFTQVAKPDIRGTFTEDEWIAIVLAKDRAKVRLSPTSPVAPVMAAMAAAETHPLFDEPVPA